MTMNKYSVDKSDPVEKAAKGMVKEGSEDNISDARENVVSNKEKKERE